MIIKYDYEEVCEIRTGFQVWRTLGILVEGMYLWGERVSNHGISLVIRAGFYDTELEAGWYLTSPRATPTDSHIGFGLRMGAKRFR